MERPALNQALFLRGDPLFWVEDQNEDGAVDARETVQIWSLRRPSVPDPWTPTGAFTADTVSRLRALQSVPGPTPESIDELLAAELAQGAPTLVYTDLRRADPFKIQLTRDVEALARVIEELYQRQLGSLDFKSKIPDSGPALALFARNQAPWCMAEATESNPACNAVPGAEAISGLYPPELQAQADFCAQLAARDDAEALLAPTVAVRRRNESLVAVPYSSAFAPQTEEAAAHLTRMAERFASREELAGYLRAAAEAFRTNDWAHADEMWLRMDAASRVYLRVAPDEAFFSPCGRKAMFHLSFGWTDTRTESWQRKLRLFRQEMETEVARLSNGSYQARRVDFRLPDFVQIVLNAGDSRRPFGAYIGQSLPNFGPLSENARRTVAMVNLYADPDSRAQLLGEAEAVFCSIEAFTRFDEARLISTAFHDVARNLGPTTRHQVDGQTDKESFGGALAATMEELQAQTLSQHLIRWLAAKDLLSETTAREVFSFGLLWALSHYSRNMYAANGRPRPYSHLAAIEIAQLMEADVLEWRSDQTAANGRDRGCFAVGWNAVDAALEELVSMIVRIRATASKEEAERLVDRFVRHLNDEIHDAVQERWRRFPRSSFVYGLRYPAEAQR